MKTAGSQAVENPLIELESLERQTMSEPPLSSIASREAELLASLIEQFPVCFDMAHPRPLKVGIHHDLLALGFPAADAKPSGVRRVLARYCNRPRYRNAVRAGAVRVDLHGQPAGVVTEQELVQAQKEATPRAVRLAAEREARPSNDTPLPQEALVSGRLSLIVKFSELPASLPVRDGLKIGIQTEEGRVIAILAPKTWRKLQQKAHNTAAWVMALSGALERFANGEIVLKHPTVQFFEKQAPAEAPATVPEASRANSRKTPRQGADTLKPEGLDQPSAGSSRSRLRLKDRPSAKVPG